jgi:hypothetical protein
MKRYEKDRNILRNTIHRSRALLVHVQIESGPVLINVAP